jgi:hypothetical protein
MISRLSIIAIPALILLAGCEDMMAGGGTIGSGTNTGVGAISADTTGTTPAGVVAAQVATPGDAGECERLALIIEDSASTEVARQAAIDDRARIGCPTLAPAG